MLDSIKDLEEEKLRLEYGMVHPEISIIFCYSTMLLFLERDSTMAELRLKDVEVSQVMTQIEDLKTALKEEETLRNEYINIISYETKHLRSFLSGWKSPLRML